MKKIVLFVPGICLSVFCWSQGIIKGKITDTTTNKPLGYATVTVFKAIDTTLLTYRLSSPDGEFRVPGLPLDVNCRVVISFTGFTVYRKEFTINAAQNTLDLGTVIMTVSYTHLRAHETPEH